MTASNATSGVVIAPAGYGKTHRLIDMVGQSTRALVLTHTNVAVANIKRRAAANPHHSIETIDAFARRLACSFPTVSGVAPECLDWPAIRAGAIAVLRRPAIRRAIGSSYDQVLVDEYQDCSSSQVGLIRDLAATLPTIVFGDPLQSIFDPMSKGTDRMGWDDKVADWQTLETLETPWRWINAPDHGQWVVAARRSIECGTRVSLRGRTTHLHVMDTSGAFLSRTIGRSAGTWAIIVGDSKRPGLPAEIAKRHRWNFMEVAELSHPVELDIFAKRWDAGMRVLAVLELAKSSISNCGAVTSFGTCLSNAHKSLPTRSKSELASLANHLACTGTSEAALAVLQALEAVRETAVYRPDLLGRVKRALQIADSTTTFADAIETVQARIRMGLNRMPSGPLVGSVLRLKGLEFDHVAIVEPNSFSTPEELYVAISRGRLSCTVVCDSSEGLRWFCS